MLMQVKQQALRTPVAFRKSDVALCKPGSGKTPKETYGDREDR